MISRCFAFGCSFTHWFYWPTWADYIGIGYEEYYNLAMPGSSNRTVHNRVIEANNFYQFTENDLVLIGITNFGRMNWLETKDRNLSWCCHGGPINWPNNDKTRFLKSQFWEERYGIYDTWLMITSLTDLFKAKAVNFHFIMSMDNRHFIDRGLLSLNYKELQMSKKIYNLSLTPLSLQEYSTNPNEHPIAEEHFNYVKKYLPNLLTEESTSYHNEIIDSIDYSCSEEQVKIYSKIRARYLDKKVKNVITLYGSYH